MDNKALIDNISRNTKRSKENIEDLMDAFTDVITSALRDGDSIAIPSIGTLETKLRKERIMVHPSTGERLCVPPKVTVAFKPSTTLKQKLK